MIWRTRNSNNWIWGLLAGAAIGAVMGVLFAPKKGKHLRADIARKTGKLLDDAEECIDQAASKASDVAGDVKKRTEHILKGAHKAASAVIEKVSG